MITEATHTCSKCRVSQPHGEFHRNASKPSGLSAWCKSCRKIADGSHTRRAMQHRHSKSWRRKHRASRLVHNIRARAKKMGIAFDLDSHMTDIQRRIDAGVCELTGIPLDLDGCLSFNSPSIDRIAPSAGYVYSNIRVVCFAMNCALNAWGEDVLLGVVTAWIEHRGQHQGAANGACGSKG